jgi:hypothetical protein
MPGLKSAKQIFSFSRVLQCTTSIFQHQLPKIPIPLNLTPLLTFSIMHFSMFALAALPILATAAPMSMRQADAKGTVKMAFETGGQTDVVEMQVGENQESNCMSIASGGLLVAMQISSDVSCRMKSGACGEASAVSPEMTGDVNLNGSGEMAQLAQSAISVECGASNVDGDASIVKMAYSISGQQEETSLDVSSGGCLSMPSELTVDALSLGSKVTCQLSTDCSGQSQVGPELKGEVDMSSGEVQQAMQEAGAMKCTAAQ